MGDHFEWKRLPPLEEIEQQVEQFLKLQPSNEEEDFEQWHTIWSLQQLRDEIRDCERTYKKSSQVELD